MRYTLFSLFVVLKMGNHQQHRCQHYRNNLYPTVLIK